MKNIFYFGVGVFIIGFVMFLAETALDSCEPPVSACIAKLEQ